MASVSVAAARRPRSTPKSTKQPSYYDPRAVIVWSYRNERGMDKIRRKLSHYTAPMSPDDAMKAFGGIERSVASFEKDVRDLDNLAKLDTTITSFRKKFGYISKTLEAIEWEHVFARNRARVESIRVRAEKAIRDGQKVIKLKM